MALAGAGALSALAQPSGGGLAYCQTNEFVCRAWRVEDGLPQNSVTAMLQAPDGYLWLGTRGGLARFDGVRFVVFGVAEGLQGLNVLTLCQDRQGALWIGAANCLSRYAGGRFTTFTTRDGLAGDLINDVAEDPEGTLWVATVKGLSRWREGRFETIGPERGLSEPHVRKVLIDANGAVWASVLNLGLMRWDGKAFVNALPSAPRQRQEPYCLMRDPGGRIWAGYLGRVLCLNGESITTYGRAEGVPNVRISCLAAAADGTVWAGTFDQGLYHLRDGKFLQVRQPNGLSDEAVQAIVEDRERNLWVGTRVGGLNRVKAGKLTTLRIVDETTEVKPMSLAESPGGVFWVGTSGRGLYRIEGNLPMQISLDHPQMYVRAITATEDGSIWGGRSGSLCHWKDGKLLGSYGAESWLRGDVVECLCEDRRGGLWVGTRNGKLVHWNAEQFTAFTNGLPSSRMTSMVQQPDGTLWIGFYGAGLGRLKAGAFTLYGKAQGLKSGTIRALLLDAEGTVWVGTEGGGLSRLREGRWDTFTAAQGVAQDTIVQLLEDDAGYLWLGTHRGIYRIARHELNNLAAGRTSRVESRLFDRSDGMDSAQCIGAFGAGLKTRSGSLWFSTDRGIAVINPKEQMEEVTPPLVHVEELLVDNRLWHGRATRSGSSRIGGDPAEPLRIPPGRRQVEFHYTGLNLSAPERVRFRYRLEGLDSDWVEAGTRRVANYGYVPPGNYRFRVMAHGGNGVWSEADGSVALVVPRRYWQTWWFRVAVLAAFTLSVAAIVRYVSFQRLRRRLRLVEQQATLQRERARIAKDIHDDLGANLTQIALLGELAQRDQGRQDKVAERLGTISATARQTIKALDEIVWAVNPRNDTLSHLVEYTGQFALDYLRLADIRCRLDFPDSLPARELSADLRHNLFLAAKEALTNIVKHARATETWLRVNVTVFALELAIEDNGQGFTPGAETADGNGLRNLRQRLGGIGGECEIESRPGAGTRVMLRLPWRQH